MFICTVNTVGEVNQLVKRRAEAESDRPAKPLRKVEISDGSASADLREREGIFSVEALEDLYKIFGIDIGLLFDQIGEFFLKRGDDALADLFFKRNGSANHIDREHVIADRELLSQLADRVIEESDYIWFLSLTELLESEEEELAELRDKETLSWLYQMFDVERLLIINMKSKGDRRAFLRKALALSRLKQSPILFIHNGRSCIVDGQLTMEEALKILEEKLVAEPRLRTVKTA